VQLVRATEGLTGSEVEHLFIGVLHEAFSRRAEPTDLSITVLLNHLVPLSKLMGEHIEALRKWAAGNPGSARTGNAEKSRGLVNAKGALRKWGRRPPRNACLRNNPWSSAGVDAELLLERTSHEARLLMWIERVGGLPALALTSCTARTQTDRF
jgi:hypothetical protein